MTWLARTPMALVRALGAMLPRLEAEESLLTVTRTAIGSGSLKPGEAQRVMARWERQSQGRDRRPAPVTPAALEAMGISYQVVPPEPGQKS